MLTEAPDLYSESMHRFKTISRDTNACMHSSTL